jgi:hypothetical protein
LKTKKKPKKLDKKAQKKNEKRKQFEKAGHRGCQGFYQKKYYLNEVVLIFN